jgi:hypothetical protein
MKQEGRMTQHLGNIHTGYGVLVQPFTICGLENFTFILGKDVFNVLAVSDIDVENCSLAETSSDLCRTLTFLTSVFDTLIIIWEGSQWPTLRHYTALLDVLM